MALGRTNLRCLPPDTGDCGGLPVARIALSGASCVFQAPALHSAALDAGAVKGFTRFGNYYVLR